MIIISRRPDGEVVTYNEPDGSHIEIMSIPPQLPGSILNYSQLWDMRLMEVWITAIVDNIKRNIPITFIATGGGRELRKKYQLALVAINGEMAYVAMRMEPGKDVFTLLETQPDWLSSELSKRKREETHKSAFPALKEILTTTKTGRIRSNLTLNEICRILNIQL